MLYYTCNIYNITISPWIIVVSYFLFALSEINIIPMGYAMIGRFDAKYNSTILTGLWSAALSLGSWGSGKIAIILTDKYLIVNNHLDYNVESYSKIFESLFIISNLFFIVIIVIINIIMHKKIKI